VIQSGKLQTHIGKLETRIKAQYRVVQDFTTGDTIIIRWMEIVRRSGTSEERLSVGVACLNRFLITFGVERERKIPNIMAIW
jgi:hypothetical protein